MESFLSDWMSHPEYWFNCDHKYDSYITETYGSLLSSYTWDKTESNIRYHLSCIILYDQIPRHIYRNYQNKEEAIRIYLQEALKIHKFVCSNYDVSEYNAMEWSFFSLPVRHSNVPSEIIGVIQDTWQRIKREPEEGERKQYLKFLKACYQRMPMNQEKFIDYSVDDTSYVQYDYQELYQYVDILGYCPAVQKEINEIPMNTHNIIEDFIIKNRLKRVILSLSGGVDSLVCSYILKKLQPKWKYEFVAVHIDYCNRSRKEYDFVRDWCMYLKIPLYTRHMTEIQRGPCMDYGLRSVYEEYTKKVRFQTYKTVWDHLGYPDFPKVILGHNSDDCFENILTNICNRNKYENLKGMEEQQMIDDIIFLRPMLSIPKKGIYAFAHNIGIPYLKDSTPEWSQRGKIRDNVRPTLEGWNPQIIPAMFELSNMLMEYEMITETVIMEMVSNTSTREDRKELLLPYSNTLFSKMIWSKYFKNIGIKVSHKSLTHFMTHFEEFCMSRKTNKCRVMLNKNKGVQCKIRKDNTVHMEILTLNDEPSLLGHLS